MNDNTTDFYNDILSNLTTVAEALIEAADLKAGSLVVLGCSSSEIMGHRIGHGSSPLTGKVVVETLLRIFTDRGIWLAVQGCEHINRSLVVEREARERFNLSEVSVVPAFDAGGSAAVAAYAFAKDPVVVSSVQADAGIDIGDTSIGQFVKYVQIPFRPGITEIGAAHVTCLHSRPPLVGGERAEYAFDRNAWMNRLEQEEESRED
ncbi:MAG TPA: TIGR01440 family protein [Clostridiaceae bacterium]|nr:TIGR01440 family protein [Clostridiaceae bacterium]